MLLQKWSIIKSSILHCLGTITKYVSTVYGDWGWCCLGTFLFLAAISYGRISQSLKYFWKTFFFIKKKKSKSLTDCLYCTLYLFIPAMHPLFLHTCKTSILFLHYPSNTANRECKLNILQWRKPWKIHWCNITEKKLASE